jgi:hypothetical protein
MMEEVEEFWEGLRPAPPPPPTREVIRDVIAATMRVHLQPLVGSLATGMEDISVEVPIDVYQQFILDGHHNAVSMGCAVHQAIEDHFNRVEVSSQVTGASVGIVSTHNAAESPLIAPGLTLEAARELVHSGSIFPTRTEEDPSTAVPQVIDRLNATNVAQLERAFDELGIPTHIEFQRAVGHGELGLLQIDLLGRQPPGTGVENVSNGTRINIRIPE